MPITTRYDSDNQSVTIAISGEFIFDHHREFSDAYRNFSDPVLRWVVDLREVNYMDSATLGMLLMLKEHAESRKQTVTLRNATGKTLDILTIAGFEQHFHIE